MVAHSSIAWLGYRSDTQQRKISDKESVRPLNGRNAWHETARYSPPVTSLAEGADKRPAEADRAPQTSTVHNLADPNAANLDNLWENEWEQNLFKAALDDVKLRLEPERYQVFDFYVNKEWPPEKVAKQFNISIDQVYQIKHRVTEALRTEVQRIEKEMT